MTKVAVDNYGNFDKVGLLWVSQLFSTVCSESIPQHSLVMSSAKRALDSPRSVMTRLVRKWRPAGGYVNHRLSPRNAAPSTTKDDAFLDWGLMRNPQQCLAVSLQPPLPNVLHASVGLGTPGVAHVAGWMSAHC